MEIFFYPTAIDKTSIVNVTKMLMKISERVMEIINFNPSAIEKTSIVNRKELMKIPERVNGNYFLKSYSCR